MTNDRSTAKKHSLKRRKTQRSCTVALNFLTIGSVIGFRPSSRLTTYDFML